VHNQWRSILFGVALTALSLLAVASFTSILAPPVAVACAPTRPVDDGQSQPEKLNQRQWDTDCSYR
jgi:hypothetical protein